MDGWKNKCNECGLELNVTVMMKVSFIFTNGCTIYMLRSTMKFTLKFTLKLLLQVSV
jgi:hypothetical protein